MTTAERGVWLAAAWAEVADIPEMAFLEATAKARKVVDHPAKLVPAIIRESAELAGILRRRVKQEEAAWNNRNAPRLAAPTSEHDDSERAEVAKLMTKLTKSLSASVSAARD